MGAKAKPGSDAGRKAIILAARDSFAAHGYEGASLRRISAQAGVLHTAMLYHFPTKDALWKAVMADMFEALEARLAACTAAHASGPADDLARALVREFVMFCSECPELHRIMTSEGRSETDRLAWLVETYSKRLFEAVAAHATAVNPLLSDPIRLYYAIIGLSASVFTLAPEYRRLSGKDPFAPREIAATADIVEAIVFGPRAHGAGCVGAGAVQVASPGDSTPIGRTAGRALSPASPSGTGPDTQDRVSEAQTGWGHMLRNRRQ